MKRGFTLVELMVVMAITGLMAAQLVGMLDDYRSDVWRSSAPIAWSSQAQTAFGLLRRDVRAAEALAVDDGLTVDATRWRVVDGQLKRGEEVIARDVTAARWTRSGDTLSVVLEFASTRGNQTATARHISRIALRQGLR